ncbi:MAG: hypothetical protein MK299_08280, partial [Pseudomonadales bacterium]|nr:hypothetical protein [Pseudomonadales bacterium]
RVGASQPRRFESSIRTKAIILSPFYALPYNRRAITVTETYANTLLPTLMQRKPAPWTVITGNLLMIARLS